MFDWRSFGFLHRKWRGLIQTHGPQWLKVRQWDREFHDGYWDDLKDTSSDRLYPVLEKYSRGGRLLDLGCGVGNTPNEMSAGSYESYLGIDISHEAVHMAEKRTRDSGRTQNTAFAQSDIATFQPEGKYRVILFRESLYYLPISHLKEILRRYAQSLDEDGAIIARMCEGMKRGPRIQEIIESSFQIVEKQDLKALGTILVFR